MALFIRIEYQWHEGTVPPPDYYEYTVSVAGDGMAEIRLLPDYPQDKPPVFTAVFRAAPSALVHIDAALTDAGELVQSDEAGAEVGAVLGGGAEKLTLVRNAEAPIVLASFDGDGLAPLASLRDAVRGLVPLDILQRLHRRRADYWRARGMLTQESRAS